jgi:hypothetical protein
MAGAAGAAAAVGGVAAAGGGSWIKKLIPIAILAVLAFFGYKYFAGAAMEKTTGAVDSVKESATGAVSSATEAATGAVSSATEAATGMMDTAKETAAGAMEASTGAADATKGGLTGAVSGLSGMIPGGEVTDQLKGLFNTAQTSLGGITDVASAEAAVPALTDLSGKLDGITAMADKLPDAAKPMFNSVVQGGLGQMEPMLDKVMTIPGVGGVLSGIVGPMKEKLAGLAGE